MAARTFWGCAVREATIANVKAIFKREQQVDRRLRFTSRNTIQKDGVTSNLFPIAVAPSARIFEYKIDAGIDFSQVSSKRILAEGSEASQVGKTKSSKRRNNKANLVGDSSTQFGEIPPRRAWYALSRHFQKTCPPGLLCAVNYQQCVYSPSHLPTNCLDIPKESLDLGWTHCALRFEGSHLYSSLPPSVLQPITNKIIVDVLRKQSYLPGSQYAVVKQTTGKALCMKDAISCAGLRIFKGVTMHALFIDTKDTEPLNPAWLATCGVSGLALCPQTAAPLTDEQKQIELAAKVELPQRILSLPPGPFHAPRTPPPTEGDDRGGNPDGTVSPSETQQNGEGSPLRIRVKRFVRAFEYKGVKIETYQVEDGSGLFTLSAKSPPHPCALREGAIYRIYACILQVLAGQNNARLLELPDGLSSCEIEHIQCEAPESSENEAPVETKTNPSADLSSCDTTEKRKRSWKRKKPMRGLVPEDSPPELKWSSNMCLALRVDTKGTVASEKSLLDEVRQHFGLGPYNEETMSQICRAVEGMPVVVSVSLRQAGVRAVRFDVDPQEIARDENMIPILGLLESNQMYAVLTDGMVAPFQTLHCCFDPRARSWQDVTVSALSLHPKQRAELLEEFRKLASDGLQAWGMHISPGPLRSTALELLPIPKKLKANNSDKISQGRMLHPPPPRFPTTLVVVGIVPESTGEAERSIITAAVKAMSQSFRTPHMHCVADEEEGMSVIMSSVQDPVSKEVKDPNSAVIIISNSGDSRLSWWLRAECLTCGILPMFVKPPRSAAKLPVLCSNVRLQMWGKMETNGLKGFDLAKEIPSFAQKRVAVVGVDTCHTPDSSTTSIVLLLLAPERTHTLTTFWQQDARGQEVDRVAENFGELLQRAAALYDGLDEVVVFQDGDVFSELLGMRQHVPVQCGMTFMCLHKRTSIRFIQERKNGTHVNIEGGIDTKNFSTVRVGEQFNVGKGTVVQCLTPSPLTFKPAADSFFLQNHNTNMSTARTVQYTVHSISPNLDVEDVQRLSFLLAHVMATQSTKLPLPTRCAHKLAEKVEYLLDVAPGLTSSMIPMPLAERMWFL